MNLTARLTEFGTGLSAALSSYLSGGVHHYTRPLSDEKSFCIWQEGGEDEPFYSDNRKSEVVITGTADLYTLDEFDVAIDKTIEYLDTATNSWRIEDVLFESDTGFIHYSFSWRLVWEKSPSSESTTL